jgi:hypothetical protein
VVSGLATVSGSTVTITGVGSVSIEASQAGNTSYNAATPVVRSFSVGKASQTINFPYLANKTFGSAPFALGATASSGLGVRYRVVAGPATVSGNILTLTGTGTVTVEGSQPGNTNYNAAYNVQRSFSVTSSTATTTTTTATTTGGLGELAPTTSTMSVFPNPVTTEASVSITVAQTTTGSVEIFNMQGVLMQRMPARTYERGVPTIVKINASNLNNGIYIVRLATAAGLVTQRFEVMR